MPGLVSLLTAVSSSTSTRGLGYCFAVSLTCVRGVKEWQVNVLDWVTEIENSGTKTIFEKRSFEWFTRSQIAGLIFGCSRSFK